MGRATASSQPFFSRHAASYARSESHARGGDLRLLVELLAPRRTEIALDVATGTGFTAIALAPLVSEVVGLDLVGEMLREASRLAAENRIANASFWRAEATSIPVHDPSFDIVTVRRAAHHFPDLFLFLREARRVLLPGGRLGIADMSPSEGTELFCNKIERLRDASHVRAFSFPEWVGMVTEAGFSLEAHRTISEPVTFDQWLYPVPRGGEEEEEVRRAWETAPQSTKEVLGLRTEPAGVKAWTKSWVVLVARRE